MLASPKRALICGASAGIGKAIAEKLAATEIEVILLARRRQQLLHLQADIQRQGQRALVIDVDLEDRQLLKQKIASFLATGPIHILINNSAGPPAGALLDATENDFLQAFSRHVLASHLLVKLLLPGMQQAGFGRIINIISTSVYEPIPNLGVSNTTRGAMAAWAKSLSRELPPGITINNVLPGFTDTERLQQLKHHWAKQRGLPPQQITKQWLAQVPEGRLANPAETASAVSFLASEEAGYIRGTSLAVDGGRMRSI